MSPKDLPEPPEPRVGMVINYAYLWARQADQGMDAGEKIRPCAILAVREEEDKTKTVFVSPITHTPPFNPRAGILLGQATGDRLGLNTRNSWLMCSEVNEFTWPGYDMYLVQRQPQSYVFGDLPRSVLIQAREKLAEFHGQSRLKFVPRNPAPVIADAG
jgi:hypothetical protein